MINKKYILFGFIMGFSEALYASFIESTIGTAVVNDATATYHNPAALILVEKNQMVALGSKAVYHGQFSGRSVEMTNGYFQTGIAKEHTNYNLPSGYLSIPIHSKARLGFGILLDKFSSDIDEPSILRYDQSSTKIKK